MRLFSEACYTIPFSLEKSKMLSNPCDVSIQVLSIRHCTARYGTVRYGTVLLKMHWHFFVDSVQSFDALHVSFV